MGRKIQLALFVSVPTLSLGVSGNSSFAQATSSDDSDRSTSTVHDDTEP